MNTLTKFCPLFGYYPEPTEFWLIVKPSMKDIALKTFENTGKNIRWKMPFGSSNWLNRIPWKLYGIARIEPQAACSCFVSGYKHKLTYIMRTIPNISHQLEKIDELVLTKFISAITGGIYVNPHEHYLFSLPAKYGGFASPNISRACR